MTTPYQNPDAAVAGLLVGGEDTRVDSFTAAQDIEFGIPVFAYPGEKTLYPFYLDMSKIVFDGDFVTSNTIIITVNGTAAATVTFASDHDTTATAVQDAVAALTGVECVLDPSDTANRTFFIRTKGATAVVTEVVAAGAGQASGTITYENAQINVGLSLRTIMPASGTAVYPQYDDVNVLERGKCYCEVNVAVNQNLVAYLDIAGADSGKLNIAGTALNARFRSNTSAAGLAVVEINGQTEATNADAY